ncbi:universal stress protein [Halovivax gelatinilyticus]|uniref:universal stress protein n=1 Tax=Halovivax gelatinilyticus TaxID=2961597 RepID=UPI0020CA4326|nr:universal stress protein [Halovivax gelatinilyticus]
MYDRVLVPTDGSQAVERAIDHAIELADAHDAVLRAVYVVNAASYGGLPMETAWDGIGNALRDEGQGAVDRVAELVEESGVDVDVETVVLEGSPSRSIVDHARSSDCDLIVMGTHGRGGINRLLLGSVAERVVRSSPIPVMTVRVGATSPDESAIEPAVGVE